MIARLTTKSLVVPAVAWPAWVAAARDGRDLPSPVAHGAALAAVSIVATTIGVALAGAPGAPPYASVVGVVVFHAMAVAAGHLGSVALAVALAPRLVTLPAEPPLDPARYASLVSLPLAVSGAAGAAGRTDVALYGAAIGIVLAAVSAALGARSALDLRGAARVRAAFAVTLVATVPVLASVGLRLLVVR